MTYKQWVVGLSTRTYVLISGYTLNSLYRLFIWIVFLINYFTFRLYCVVPILLVKLYQNNILLNMSYILSITMTWYPPKSMAAVASGNDSHHPFDSLWKQEALIDGIHCVIRLNITLFLQQDWPSVQSIISPKHCKSTFFVAMDKSPINNARVFQYWLNIQWMCNK